MIKTGIRDVTAESGMDFRAMLKHREYEDWEIDQMNPDYSGLKPGEGDRRPSVEIPKVELKKVGRRRPGDDDVRTSS